MDSNAAQIHQGFYHVLNVGPHVSQTLLYSAPGEREQRTGWGINVGATLDFFANSD